jgi:hypothetical protein
MRASWGDEKGRGVEARRRADAAHTGDEKMNGGIANRFLAELEQNPALRQDLLELMARHGVLPDGELNDADLGSVTGGAVTPPPGSQNSPVPAVGEGGVNAATGGDSTGQVMGDVSGQYDAMERSIESMFSRLIRERRSKPKG